MITRSTIPPDFRGDFLCAKEEQVVTVFVTFFVITLNLGDKANLLKMSETVDFFPNSIYNLSRKRA